ncbi:DUF6286 domain-containing protein [Streptomyces sp. BYX5S]
MTGAAERGTTVVSGRAVRRIAGRAAGEATATPVRTGSGTATVRGRRADVGVKVALPFPAPLPETARLIEAHVTDRTRELTGLHVTPARVQVTELLPVPGAGAGAATGVRGASRSAGPAGVSGGSGPAGAAGVSGGSGPAGAAGVLGASGPAGAVAGGPGAGGAKPLGPGDSGSRTPLRWWSPRRLPAALLALAAATVCGALAVDLVRVHWADRTAASWRTGTVHWLERHGPDAPLVGIAAAALAVLGVLMIVLAVSPGRRGLLTVVSPAAPLRAAMDRPAIALVVRDAVGDVAGIDTVRVRVRRRRVVVRAQLAFGDRAVARAAVGAAARGVLDDCRLRRAPGLRVKVRPGEAWSAGTATAPGPRTPGDTGTGTGTDTDTDTDTDTENGTDTPEVPREQKGRATDAP